MPTIKVGENAIIKKNLFYEDGTTPLLIADLSLLKVELRQNNKVMAAYTYAPTPDPVQGQVREGDTASQVEVELTKDVSSQLLPGVLSLRIIMEKVDAEFVVDSVLKDISEAVELTIEL